MSGKQAQDLIPPCELPFEFSDVWGAFALLNGTRPQGMNIGAITYCEIDAYCRLQNVTFTAFEITVLKKLDALALSHFNKAKK